MIEFTGVTKTHHSGDREVEIFQNLEFTVKSPGVYAVVGKSGSGKSTLLTLLAGLDLADQGQIKIDNNDLQVMNEAERTKFRRDNIGIVFQDFHLLPFLTVEENIALPLKMKKEKDIKSKVTEMAQLLGLEERLHFFPGTLSGGEKQRVAIGRAFITNPKIILADEPTGNLDFETGEKISNQLIEVAKKFEQTLIIVTHDQDLASKCDRIFELKNKVML